MYCLVVAAIECLFIPFGTVLGVFTIVVLNRSSVRSLFRDGRPKPHSRVSPFAPRKQAGGGEIIQHNAAFAEPKATLAAFAEPKATQIGNSGQVKSLGGPTMSQEKQISVPNGWVMLVLNIAVLLVGVG